LSYGIAIVNLSDIPREDKNIEENFHNNSKTIKRKKLGAN